MLNLIEITNIFGWFLSSTPSPSRYITGWQGGSQWVDNPTPPPVQDMVPRPLDWRSGDGDLEFSRAWVKAMRYELFLVG